MSKQKLSFSLNTDIDDEFEDIDVMNSWSKFRIIECRLSIGRKDFELTKIGTKNRIR